MSFDIGLGDQAIGEGLASQGGAWQVRQREDPQVVGVRDLHEKGQGLVVIGRRLIGVIDDQIVLGGQAGQWISRAVCKRRTVLVGR